MAFKLFEAGSSPFPEFVFLLTIIPFVFTLRSSAEKKTALMTDFLKSLLSDYDTVTFAVEFPPPW